MVESHEVHDAASALRWIGDVMELSVSRNGSASVPAARRSVEGSRRRLGRALERRIRREPRRRGASRRDAADGLFVAPPGARARDRRRRGARCDRRARVSHGVRVRRVRVGDRSPRGARGLSLRVGREPGARRAEERAAGADRWPAHPACDRRSAFPPRSSAPRRSATASSSTSRRGSRSPRRATKRSTAGSSAHERISPSRRHRRARGLGKDRAHAGAVQGVARQVRHRGRHQRHLHGRRRQVPRDERGARARSASWASRPAGARTRRFARTRRSTWKPSRG